MRTHLGKVVVGLAFLAASGNLQAEGAQPAQDKSKTMLFGDFLWWAPDANDMPLAVREVAKSDGITIDKKEINLRGKWGPGFRVGGAYEFGFYDKLSLFLTYTRFHGASKHKEVVADKIGTPFLRQHWNPFLGPIAFSASGKWKTELDVADLGIAREFQATEHLFFVPYAGVRLAWVGLKYNANYDGVWINTDDEIQTMNTKMRNSSLFNGGGLRAGSEFSWEFTPNIALVGNVSASLFYGHFKIKEKFVGGDTVETGFLIPLTEVYKENMHGVRSNVDFALGLAGSVDCGKNGCKFSLFAGYELSEWFRFNELFEIVRAIDSNGNATFSSEHVSDDLGFQGLTVRACLAF